MPMEADLVTALDYATAYARKGWPVFPVHSYLDGRCTCGGRPNCQPGKHPRTSRGVLDATTSLDVVARFGARWPASNVGIATGGRAGVWVLDVDAKDGGLHTLEALEDEHGALPPTPTVHTGGGGRHLYFKSPAGSVVKNATKVFPGIDIRGEGGYVIAPPSLHATGGRYVWDSDLGFTDVAVAEAPPWLVKAVVPPTRDGGDVPSGKTSAEWLSIMEAGKSDGARNDSIARIIGYLLRRNVDIRMIEQLIQAWNQVFVRPPQDPERILKTLQSVASGHFARERARGSKHV